MEGVLDGTDQRLFVVVVRWFPPPQTTQRDAQCWLSAVHHTCSWMFCALAYTLLSRGTVVIGKRRPVNYKLRVFF